MGKCYLCNDFERGCGEAYIIETWIAKLLSSPCHYCKLLVQAMNAFEPDFLARLLRQDYEVSGDSQPGVTYRVTALDHGEIGVESSLDRTTRLVLVFFESAQDHAPNSEIHPLRLPVLGEVAPVPGDARMWAFLRATLQTCLKEHSTCSRRQDPTWCPERLLVLQHDLHGEGNTKIRLIDTRHERPQSAYIALSHCWGATQPIHTTSHNIASHRDEIEWSCLARTFQDAVTTAQEMDVYYIWIDSLCITQDDQEDWARNSEQMDNVYQNALFVVAAVSSASGAEPFLGPEAPTRRHDYCAVDLGSREQNALHNHDFGSGLKARKFGFELNAGIVLGPLEERAWAYQERFCATRTMSFTHVEAKWECKTAMSCECSGKLENKAGEDLFNRNAQGAAKENVLYSWRRLVIKYGVRALTYTNDRLPALAGIASRYHTLLKSSYVSGVWEMDLPFSLGWYRMARNPCRAMLEGVPTWSWASMEGGCWWLWYFAFNEGPDPDAPMHSKVDLLQVDCSPRTSNAFGAVHLGSYVKLRGRVVKATMESDISGHACVRREGFIRQLVLLDCQIVSSPKSLHSSQYGHTQRALSNSTPLNGINEDNATDNASEQPPARTHGVVFCLLLHTGSCQGQTRPCVLILGKASDVDGTSYQRLGIGCSTFDGDGAESWMMGDKESYFRGEEGEVFGLWEQWETWFEDVEPECIKIV